MQSYTDYANKNGVTLIEDGQCQFCGAEVHQGIKDCVELFNQGFDYQIDFSNDNNIIYKFLSVDAHTLQHPEIHGRWNNHLHLTRLHLIFQYKVIWTYESTIKLSKYLKLYKKSHADEYLIPPKPLDRGRLSITDVMQKSNDEDECKKMIEQWALEVYNSWENEHKLVDNIAELFIKSGFNY